MQKREYLNFEGITISSYEYGEFDKIFNILSPNKGIITAIIKRIRKTSNNNLELIIDSSGIKSNSENLKIDINNKAVKVNSKNN